MRLDKQLCLSSLSTYALVYVYALAFHLTCVMLHFIQVLSSTVNRQLSTTAEPVDNLNCTVCTHSEYVSLNCLVDDSSILYIMTLSDL